MNQDKKEVIIKAIKFMLKDEDPFEIFYTIPYSFADEEDLHYSIHFRVTKVILVKELDDECPIQGEIVLTIDEMYIENDNKEWEELNYIDDISESIWDEMKDKITDKINKVFPQICLETKLYNDKEGFF